jgi:peptide/nickel transport system permease protein
MTMVSKLRKAPSPVRPRRLESPAALATARFFSSRIATIAIVVLALTLLLALAAPLISPQDPFDLSALDIMDGELAPGMRGGQGHLYLLGTDDQGRDMLSAILYGLRISLAVGLCSTFISLAIGVVMGLLAGYFGGWVDALIMRLVDLQLSFPAILVALILLAVMGRGVDKVVLALVLVQWAYYARTIRGNALVERDKEYIEAARCLAIPRIRILFGHILPNCLPPLIVVATVQIAHAISLEATLSFLGVGVPVTQPSLGLLIANGQEYILSGQYWITFFPGLALLVTIVSINLVGDHLRDALNPRLHR